MTDLQLRTVDSVLLKESIAHQTGSARIFLCTCGHMLSHKGGGIPGRQGLRRGRVCPCRLWAQLYMDTRLQVGGPVKRMGTPVWTGGLAGFWWEDVHVDREGLVGAG